MSMTSPSIGAAHDAAQAAVAAVVGAGRDRHVVEAGSIACGRASTSARMRGARAFDAGVAAAETADGNRPATPGGRTQAAFDGVAAPLPGGESEARRRDRRGQRRQPTHGCDRADADRTCGTSLAYDGPRRAADLSRRSSRPGSSRMRSAWTRSDSGRSAPPCPDGFVLFFGRFYRRPSRSATKAAARRRACAPRSEQRCLRRRMSRFRWAAPPSRPWVAAGQDARVPGDTRSRLVEQQPAERVRIAMGDARSAARAPIGRHCWSLAGINRRSRKNV